MNLKISFINFFSKLIRIKKTEPLHIFSLIVIIFLDLFILGNIFDGLDRQSELLRKPYEYIPQICRTIILDNTWLEDKRTQKLASYIEEQNNIFYEKDKIDPNKVHQSLKSIMLNFKEITEDKNLFNLFENRTNLLRKYNNLDDYQKNLDNKGKIILKEISVLDKKINLNPKVSNLFNLIDTIKLNKTLIRNEIKNERFRYSLKEFLVQFLFLLPLLVLFIFWNNKSLKKEKDLQVFISSHLIVVSFIPIFFRICDFLFYFIPNKVFKKLMTQLIKLKIIAIWSYGLAFFSILFAFFLIYIIQKKIFTKDKIQEKRFKKSMCIKCGVKLKNQENYCFKCGEHQKIKCTECGTLTYRIGEYCINCGKNIKRELKILKK